MTSYHAVVAHNNETVANETLSPQQTEFMISYLLPYFEYTFTVTVVNDGGYKSQHTITWTTREAGIHYH